MRRFKHLQKTIPEFNGTGEMSVFVTLASQNLALSSELSNLVASSIKT